MKASSRLLRRFHVEADTRSRDGGREPSFSWLALGFALCVVWNTGCQPSVNSSRPPTPRRDINAVLAAHDRELLALPGVVGVYVGLLDDEKTPCLKVMLARDEPAVRQRIPQQLEGYPVVQEVTGKIRPLK